MRVTPEQIAHIKEHEKEFREWASLMGATVDIIKYFEEQDGDVTAYYDLCHDLDIDPIGEPPVQIEITVFKFGKEIGYENLKYYDNPITILSRFGITDITDAVGDFLDSLEVDEEE